MKICKKLKLVLKIHLLGFYMPVTLVLSLKLVNLQITLLNLLDNKVILSILIILLIMVLIDPFLQLEIQMLINIYSLNL